MKARKSSRLVVLFCASAIVPGCEKTQVEWEATGPTVATVTAEGTQAYRCVSGSDGKLAWTSTGPQAVLFDDKHQKVGTHSKCDTGPQWEIAGDRIVGTKVHVRPSAKAASIPELQLSGTCTGNGTTFGKVVLIERLDTEGGIEPAIEGHKAGDEVSVPFKARYVFHAAKT